MKKIMSFRNSILILLALCVLSSCAIHQGYITNSAALTSNNFSYVHLDAYGMAQARYIFGIGGLNHSALVDYAKRDLLSKTPLRDNQALVNLSVNWKSTVILPFWVSVQCTVTADIVEFK